jgi:hypothetical protein
MQQVNALREKAKVLREIAARSTDHRAIHEKLLALADQCEELAESLSETLSMAIDKLPPPNSN